MHVKRGSKSLGLMRFPGESIATKRDDSWISSSTYSLSSSALLLLKNFCSFLEMHFIYTSVLPACVSVPLELREGVKSSRTGVMDGCETHCGY